MRRAALALLLLGCLAGGPAAVADEAVPDADSDLQIDTEREPTLPVTEAQRDAARRRGAGNYQEALVALEVGLAAAVAAHGSEHPKALALMEDLATVHDLLRQDGNALALREEVLATRRRLLGDAHPDTTRAMGDLADSYRATGRMGKALALRQEAFDFRVRTLGERDRLTLLAMGNLAAAHAALNQHERALEWKERRLRLSREALGEADRGTIAALANLSATYKALGRLSDALEARIEVLRLARGSLGERHRMTLDAMGLLGTLYSELGRHDEARQIKEERLRLCREGLGNTHPTTLTAMGNLAATYSALGLHDLALPLKEDRLRVSRRVLGNDHPSTLVAMGNLAATYIDLGRHDGALALREERWRLSRAKLGERHQSTLVALGGWARALVAAGRPAEALPLQQERLALSREVEGRFHLRTLNAMRWLAETHVQLGQLGDAVAVLADYVAAAEQLRSDPGLTAENRRALFAELVPRYRLYARLLAQAGRDGEAFRIAEMSKARTLLESTALRNARQSGVLPMAEQAALDRLERDAEVVEAALARTTEAARRLELEARRQRVQRDYLSLQADLRQRFPRYARLSEVRIVGMAEGARLLPANGLFVSYLQADDGWLVYVLDARGQLTVDVIAPADAAALAKQVADYRAALARSGSGGAAPWRGLVRKPAEGASSSAALAATLGSLLLGPVASRLAPGVELIVSPDGVLATLPFETLVVGDVPLVAAHDIRYAQSLSVYALLRERGDEYARLRGRKPLLAMGNPVFPARPATAQPGTPEEFSLLLDRGAAAPQGLSRAYGYLGLQWSELPGTARELEDVSRLFGTHPVTREAASEATLRQMNARGELADFRYLLFSTHGYLSLQEPALSALVLSQPLVPADATEDGYVSASEWPAYRLQSDLLMLSACETALGKQAQGEGIMGLPYALYIAGNKTTVLTLWPINDDASAEFVRRFFARLKDGMAESRALSETKREFLADDRYSAPQFWAPFVMYGG